MSTRTLIRLSKALLSLSIGLLATLVVFNNLIDYGTNFRFVQHVMSMDTTFPDSKLRKRSVVSSRSYHIAYWLIIGFEAVIGWLCSAGGVAMLRAINKDSERFHESKRLSIAGLTGGLMLWFTGFQVLATEWFAMWQSKTWDGLPAASRLTQIVSTMLLFVSMRNDE